MGIHLAGSVMSLADRMIGEIGLRVVAVDTVETIVIARGMTEAIVGIGDPTETVVAMIVALETILAAGTIADRITGEVGVIVVVVIRAEIVMVGTAGTVEIAMVAEIVITAAGNMKVASATKAEVVMRDEMGIVVEVPGTVVAMEAVDMTPVVPAKAVRSDPLTAGRGMMEVVVLEVVTRS